MLSLKKTLLLVILCSSLSACEHKSEPIVTPATQTPLSTEQQALLAQSMQQALILQQLQLQQQIYAQTFQSVQTHEQQLNQQLRTFSATQACVVAGNCRVETRIVPKP